MTSSARLLRVTRSTSNNRNLAKVLAVAFCAAGTATSAFALAMKCEKPARSAEYSATSTVAKTETGTECLISVDGAVATPALATIAKATAACVARLHNPAGTYSMYADVLARFAVPVLAAASAPGFKGDAKSLPKPPQGDEAACLSFFDDLMMKREVYSALAPFRPLADEVAECLAVPRDAHGAKVVCERPKGELVLRFKTDLGAHVVRLPYPD